MAYPNLCFCFLCSRSALCKEQACNDRDYTKYLEAKLDEEVSEYHQDKNLEELADILEVVYALAENLGASREELLAVYEEKHQARGGLKEKYFLVSD